VFSTIRSSNAALVLAAAAGLATLALVAGAGAAGRYTDPGGDSSGGPDIKGVAVASDANGQIQFTLGIDNFVKPSDARAYVFVDTDLNATTGAPGTDGADYVFFVDQSDNSYTFMRWNGSDWDDGIPFATVSVSSTSTGATISVNRSELSGTGEFNFWVRSRSGDVSGNQSDTAPDADVWNYSLQASGPDIQSVLVQTSPAIGPRAGKRFTLTPTSLKVPHSEPGLLPTPESYTCTAKLGGKAIAGTGTGGCSWIVPKKARGKALVVGVTVSYQGGSSTVPFSYKVM